MYHVLDIYNHGPEHILLSNPKMNFNNSLKSSKSRKSIKTNLSNDFNSTDTQINLNDLQYVLNPNYSDDRVHDSILDI